MFSLENFYKKYTLQRPLNWTIEHFALLVEFFPAVLVLNSDGVFDKKEAKYLDKLIENIGHFLEDEGFSLTKIKTLKNEFKAEFLYLGNNIPAWKTHFLTALVEYLNLHPEQKIHISDAISLFAEVSDGVSEMETEAIDFLKDYLRLEV